ncbi:MAG: TIGR02757 family protein [Treponema sp.]|nr:TIGR02757 family protein [Treponema sp.]
MAFENLKPELDKWYAMTCTRDFIIKDPVQFPHRFSKREDIEIAAFLTATIAWGRRDLILRSAEKMYAIMGARPYDYVMSGNFSKLKNNNIHRTFFENDLKYFCRGFKHCYTKYNSLEKIFSASSDIWQGIAAFREEMAAANKGCCSKHLADPANSACKRINLALRWLVRKGPVDLGIWTKIKPAALYIPLDVHVARTARKLGLLDRKSNDKKAVLLLTEKLRIFNPGDPVKYDYALFAM